MSEANEALVSRWYNELFNQGNLAVADTIIAPNTVQQGEIFPNFAPGPQGHKQLVTLYKNAFPDAEITIDSVSIAEGGNVVEVNWTAHGSHQGTFMGHSATGNQVVIRGSDTWRIHGGKIVGNKCDCNHRELLRQIGALPAAPSR